MGLDPKESGKTAILNTQWVELRVLFLTSTFSNIALQSHVLLI